MNWGIVQGTWTQRGKLTDNHLDVIAGRRKVLVGNIEATCSITRDEAKQQVNRFEQRG